jgi:GNAT superfamily N-acetyltransferase
MTEPGSTERGASALRFEPLSPLHDKTAFHCGQPDLDAYFQRRARQDVSRNLARVYVLTRDGKNVDGFYTLSATSIDPTSLPSQTARKLPGIAIPATLLGRMAVDKRMQGQGLGNLVLMSALRMALDGSRVIGLWAVVVDAKPRARAFYLKNEFQPFPDKPARLFLTMAHFAQLVSGLSIAE